MDIKVKFEVMFSFDFIVLKNGVYNFLVFDICEVCKFFKVVIKNFLDS